MAIPRARLPEIRSSSEMYGSAAGELAGVPVAGVPVQGAAAAGVTMAAAIRSPGAVWVISFPEGGQGRGV